MERHGIQNVQWILLFIGVIPHPVLRHQVVKKVVARYRAILRIGISAAQGDPATFELPRLAIAYLHEWSW